MKVFTAICLDDHRIEDGDKVLELKRGEEYTVGPEKDGERMLFSSYWVWLPSDWFGGFKALGSR